MYVTLALSEDRNNGRTFQIESNHSGSDQEIRGQLDKHLKGDLTSLALALCEPGSIGNQDDAHFTRIPLLWRMPHWRIRLNSTKDTSLDILSYPENTTSGDYVRNRFSASEHRFLPHLPHSLRQQLLQNRAATAVTFTPYHCFERGLRADREIYPGPDRDVTALLVPTNRPGGSELAEMLLENTKHVLHELTLTNGNENKVKALVDRHRDHIKSFYPNTCFPQNDALAKAITEYVRQGCYFPYRVVSSALLGELVRISTANIRKASEDAQIRARKELMGFLGVGRDWSDLSFANRREILKSRVNIDGAERDLLQLIQHKSPAIVRRLLLTTDVSIDSGINKLTPENFNKQHRHLIPIECMEQRKSICWKPDEQATRVVVDDCFACTLACSAKMIMGLVSSALVRSIGCACGISGEYCSPGYSDPYICWDDLKEFVDTWIEESAHRKTTELQVHMCLDKDRCCFGIYKKGETTRGSGKGSAKQRLTSWAKKHTDAGRRVEWYGFWRKNGIEPIDGQGASFPMYCTWQHKTDFDFGYIAVFSWRA